MPRRSRKLDAVAEAEGVSSNEDLWLFFSFAMIFLVFVLMNYVSYLSAVVVKPSVPEQTEMAEAAETPETPEIRIYVSAPPSGTHYAFADNPQEVLDSARLESELETRMEAQNAPEALNVYVHAPGKALYQEVFDVMHMADATATRLLADSQVDIHLVYDSEPTHN